MFFKSFSIPHAPTVRFPKPTGPYTVGYSDRAVGEGHVYRIFYPATIKGESSVESPWMPSLTPADQGITYLIWLVIILFTILHYSQADGACWQLDAIKDPVTCPVTCTSGCTHGYTDSFPLSLDHLFTRPR